MIAGGSGFLGASILSKFEDAELVVLSRSKTGQYGPVKYVQWDAVNPGDWTAELEGSKAIINLVGKSVNCRYTDANKTEIINSRVNATKAIGKAIQGLENPPEVWINAGSAANFRQLRPEMKDEHSATGNGFSLMSARPGKKHLTHMTPQKPGKYSCGSGWCCKRRRYYKTFPQPGQIRSGRKDRLWQPVHDLDPRGRFSGTDQMGD